MPRASPVACPTAKRSLARLTRIPRRLSHSHLKSGGSQPSLTLKIECTDIVSPYIYIRTPALHYPHSPVQVHSQRRSLHPRATPPDRFRGRRESPAYAQRPPPPHQPESGNCQSQRSIPRGIHKVRLERAAVSSSSSSVFDVLT